MVIIMEDINSDIISAAATTRINPIFALSISAPKYVSVFRIDGVPIIPPLVSLYDHFKVNWQKHCIECVLHALLHLSESPLYILVHICPIMFKHFLDDRRQATTNAEIKRKGY